MTEKRRSFFRQDFNHWLMLFFFSLTLSARATEIQPITLYVGYLTQVHCRGRLFLSSIGDTTLIHWEAFPKEMGCGVVLKPKGPLGYTDLLLKTSTGDLHLILEIKKAPLLLNSSQLEIQVEPSGLKGASHED